MFHFTTKFPRRLMSEELIYPEEKVTNHIVYWWRIFAKIFSFAFFGTGSLLLSILILPFMKIIFRDKKTFSEKTRKLISFLFRVFIKVMSFMSVAKIRVFDENKNEVHGLLNLKSCVVVANHPSLLDVVMLISKIPNADVIANASLGSKNVVSKIIHYLYITSDVPFEELIERCKNSIQDGNVLIIFPEGTRSKPTGQNQFKKGAARIALAAKCPILPVYMGGNNKIGLRKKDSMFLFNANSFYKYNLFLKPQILPDEFLDLQDTIAAKRFTAQFKNALADENNKENRL